MSSSAASFRQCVIAPERLIGTFLKPPTIQGTEIIAGPALVRVGIDSLFIGRGDLTAAFGDESKDPPAVRKAVERICAAAQKAGKSISVYVGNGTEAVWLKSLGASTFVLSSDQGFLLQGARAGLAEVRGKVGAAA